MTLSQPTYQNISLEVGKTYKTRFATAETFTITALGKNMAYGIYTSSPHLGACPLAYERIIPERIHTGNIEVCAKCKEPIGTLIEIKTT